MCTQTHVIAQLKRKAAAAICLTASDDWHHWCLQMTHACIVATVTLEASVSHHSYHDSLTPQSRALAPDWPMKVKSINRGRGGRGWCRTDRWDWGEVTDVIRTARGTTKACFFFCLSLTSSISLNETGTITGTHRHQTHILSRQFDPFVKCWQSLSGHNWSICFHDYCFSVTWRYDSCAVWEDFTPTVVQQPF